MNRIFTGQIMAAPTLQDIFGTGATQDVSTITIQKSALQAVGLTPSPTNDPQALLAAIALIAKNSLTETNRATDMVNRKVTLTYVGQDLVVQSSQNYRRDLFYFALYKTTDLATIDPDDY